MIGAVSATHPAGEELIRYRRDGGMAAVRQELRVHGDGRIVLRDRRTGNATEVGIGSSELESVRSLIEGVPAETWHGRLKAFVRRRLPAGPDAMRFELRRGSRRICGASGRVEQEVSPLIAELDELLARCVRQRREELG